MAIPKVIHYCWFGGNPKPKMAEKCIKSWKRHCPDYEIVEWNESNFDVNANQYCAEAYAEKKWAFVTDYARLKILYEHGGIYFDTDVKLIKSLDKLLAHKCFMGIERNKEVHKVNTGVGLASESGFPLVKEMLDDYEGRHFLQDGRIDITTCTVRNTEILKRHGFIEEDRTQVVDDAVIYSSEYFSPMDMNNGKMYKTKNTHSIHLYSLSWTDAKHRKEHKAAVRKMRIIDFFYNIKVLPNNILVRLLGQDRYSALKKKFKKG